MISYSKDYGKGWRQLTKELFDKLTEDRDGELLRTCKMIEMLKQKAKAHKLAAEAILSEGKENAEVLANRELEAKKKIEDDVKMNKSRLMKVCYQGTFLFGNRTNTNIQYNGLVFMDFDDLTPEQCAKFSPWNQQALRDPMLQRTMLVHRSPSHNGFHCIFKADPRMSYEDNQAAYAKAIGVQHDAGCKDLARCSYIVPRSYFEYVNPEIFDPSPSLPREGESHPGGKTINNNYENLKNNPNNNAAAGNAAGNSSCDNDLFSAQNAGGNPIQNDNGAAGDGEHSTPLHNREGQGGGSALVWEHNAQGELTYKGVPYKEIIKVWWEKTGGEPVQGERNSKIQRLCTNLRYICDNRPDVLLEVLPSYGLSRNEMQAIIASQVKYNMMNFIPKTLAQVLADPRIKKAMSAHSSQAACSVGLTTFATDRDEESEFMTRKEMDYWNGRLAEIALPKGMKETVDSVDAVNRLNALIVCLPAMYTVATGFAYKIWDGNWYRLSGTSILIGAAASGKSFCKHIIKTWISPLSAEDKSSREIEKKYKKDKQAAGESKMKQARPEVMIRIVPTKASLATLLERNENAKRLEWNVAHTEKFWQRKHLFTFELEFSSIVKNLKSDFSNYADFLVKAHQDEEIGVDYQNANSANGIRNMHWNQIFGGNFVDFNRLFPKSQVLNGMPLRIMPVFIPDNAFAMNSGTNNMNAYRRKQIFDMAYKLEGMSGNVDVKPLSDRMYKHSENLANWAKEHNDRIADYIRRRACSTIGMRAGVLSAILRNVDKWDKLPVVVLNDEKGVLEENKEYAKQLKFTEDDFKLAELVADYVFDQQYKLFKADMQEMMEQRKLPAQSIIAGEMTLKKEEQFRLLPKEFTADDVAKILDIKKITAETYIYNWKAQGLAKKDKHSKKYVKI